MIRFADLRGDSFKLSKLAAENTACRYIVFCGVHFMAETADILSRDEVEVYLPDLAAGCSMADMADLDSVEAAWRDLAEVIDVDDLMPVTYVNSSADLKAFCGRHGGHRLHELKRPCRTGLGVRAAQPRAVLSGPAPGTKHSQTMGIALEEMTVWDPARTIWRQYARSRSFPAGSCSGKATVRCTRCSNPTHVEQFRRRFPGFQDSGSSGMHDASRRRRRPGRLDRIHHQDNRRSAPGSTWGVGTELHLVNRLAQEHPDKCIHFLSPMVCMCATMFRIDMPHLAWCLENLGQGTPVNRIKVPAETACQAKLALERMLEVR